MEVVEIAEIIKKLIQEIGKCRREIEDRGRAKAAAISNYDRKLAVTLAELRNNENFEFGGKTYKAPPVSVMEKIAKGICSEECFAKELAESGYKAGASNLEALKAQLNAYQSIFKHLEEI